MRPKNTPNDPQRRQRIIDAAMALLRAEGLSAVTARRVATLAAVPVGSVSYHFENVRALLLEAARQMLLERNGSLKRWSATVTPDTMVHGLAGLIHEQITTGREVTITAYELFVLGARDPEVQRISVEIVSVLQEAIATCRPSEEAAAIAAAVEGVQLHALVAVKTPTIPELEHSLRQAIAT
jgi:DNA-binding transcriptional regulator YbjK